MSFDNVYDIIVGLTPGGLEWLAFLVAGGILAFAVINAVVMSGAIYTWFERRALGRFQSRLGPNRWGPFGLFQPFADILKLLSKEDVVPDPADRTVFHIAPLFLAIPVLLVFAVIPFGENSFLGRLNVGVLFIIGVTGINTFGVFMGGYASRNKYALFGAMRGVAMLISYEVPMALALTGVALAAGSLALTDIVESQSLFFVVTQPLGFLVFMTAASAEMSRAPFDMIEAESELGSGYHTEYSGIKFAVFQLAEFLAPIVTAVIVATLFLGGTRGFDPVPGQVWFVLKVFVVIFLMLWVRATWPRLRIDQIMGFAWKGLLALSLVNLFLVAAEVEILRGDSGELTTGSLWIMAAINWAVTLAAIAGYSLTLRGRRSSLPEPVRSPLANMYAEAD
jgi:NADH-quinone oxidoreductase subunit H